MKLTCRMVENDSSFKAVPKNSTKSFRTALRDDGLRATLTQSAENTVFKAETSILTGAFFIPKAN